MSKDRLKEKAENQYRAKVDAIFSKYQTKGDEIVWNIPEEVPPPTHGDWWGPWRYNTNALELEYYDEGGKYRYGVDLGRCNSSAEVLDWIFQVNTKRWRTYECIGHLIQALRDLLHPQQNLCGGGRDKPFDASKHLRRKL